MQASSTTARRTKRRRTAPCQQYAAWQLTVGLCFLVFGSRNAWAAVPGPPPPRCVAIMGTNDVHGALEPYTVASRSPQLTAKTGGVLAASGYATNLRQVFGSRSLIVDAGDIFQGTLPSNMSLGQAMIAAYNAMGYDAAAIGNHEFDFGALPGQDTNVVANRLGVLQARIAEAHFPFLAVNIFDRQTQAPIAWKNVSGSIIKNLDGIKVGILGASTPTTPMVTKPQNVVGLDFRPPGPLVAAEAQRLRAQGADIVVLVAHMGGRCGRPRTLQADANPHDISACDVAPQEAELMALLQGLPPGTVDVAIGGHTHQFIAHWVNGVATLESGSQGHYMGWVEACLAPASAQAPARVTVDLKTSVIHGAVELCLQTWDDGTCWAGAPTTAVHPAKFLGRPVVPMPALQEAIAPYLSTVASLGNRPTGAHLPRPVNRRELTIWVAEAMRRATHSDFGFQNRGGVRTDLPAGDVAFSAAFAVLPFDNYVSQVELTGAQLARLVLHLSHYRAGADGPAFVGLHIAHSPGGLTVVTDKDQQLDPARLYTLSTTDFMVQGGDGADAIFREVPAERIHISDLGMRDAFIRFLAQSFPAKNKPRP